MELKQAIKQTEWETRNPRGYTSNGDRCDCTCHDVSKPTMCHCMCVGWPYEPDFTGDAFRERT